MANRTGASLVREALENIGIRHTFGIPGVHITEIYDELERSETIEPILVHHEACAGFMADGYSRTSNSVGTLLIVPGAGTAYAMAAIGEAFLDGIPMVVLAGAVRNDINYQFQLHQMDQMAMVAPITKAQLHVDQHDQVIPALYQAYQLAKSGEPGPVFVEIPVNVQLTSGKVDAIPSWLGYGADVPLKSSLSALNAAVTLLKNAEKPALWLGWGVRDVDTEVLTRLAEHLAMPVATTLQGLSVFPHDHPLHAGMGFGRSAVPSAQQSYQGCDCVLAVGMRFGEIATGSFGVEIPQQLIHIDINPDALDANFKAAVAIEGDATQLLPVLLQRVEKAIDARDIDVVAQVIAKAKQSYQQQWLAHNSQGRVNPAKFFQALRQQMQREAILVLDDGNHTFLAAELMPIYQPAAFISPSDFNCMGYAVPAALGAKLANPDKTVAAVVGDGCFVMTCMELGTAAREGLGCVIFVFNDGELAQIAQAQKKPYQSTPCTQLPNWRFDGVALATGAKYLTVDNDQALDRIAEAFDLAQQNVPVVVDVAIDYSKATQFTQGTMATNLKRMDLRTKGRFISRALWRKISQ